eukprot:2606248-Pyramimonas_sp.AAC.1
MLYLDLEDGPGAEVSADEGKRSSMCSPGALGELTARPGGLAGPLVSSVLNLGVDGCAGRPRRAKRRSSRRRKRGKTSAAFAGRLRKLRPTI